MTFPAYQGASGCQNRGPGATNLLWWIVNESGTDALNWGVCNCRRVRGRNVPSLHGECRACDAGARELRDPRISELVERLLPNVGRLGIQCIIWNRTIWSSRAPQGTPYRGTHPHYDHAHIELTRHAAAHLNVPTIRAVMGGQNAPIVVPLEDDVTPEDINRIAELTAQKVWDRQVPAAGSDYQPAKLVLRDVFVHARRAAGAAEEANKHASLAYILGTYTKNALGALARKADVKLRDDGSG